jgi:hypothetical protein
MSEVDEKRPLLIGLTGFAGHGKTTATNMLKTFNFYEYAFADPLKRGCMEMFGLTEEQCFDDKLKNIIDPYWGVSPREVLQKVGTELFRNQLKNAIPNINLGESGILWIRNFEKYYETNKSKNIIVSDVRNIDEAQIIKKLGGFMIRIHNPRIKMKDAYRNHASEQMINKIKYDCHLMNDGDFSDLFRDISYIIRAVISSPSLSSSYEDYMDDNKKLLVMGIAKTPCLPGENRIIEELLQNTKDSINILKSFPKPPGKT